MKRNAQYHSLIELDGGLVTGAVEMDALLKSSLPLTAPRGFLFLPASVWIFLCRPGIYRWFGKYSAPYAHIFRGIRLKHETTVNKFFLFYEGWRNSVDREPV